MKGVRLLHGQCSAFKTGCGVELTSILPGPLKGEGFSCGLISSWKNIFPVTLCALVLSVQAEGENFHLVILHCLVFRLFSLGFCPFLFE